MGDFTMGNNTMPKCACITCNNIGKYAFGVRRRGGNNAYLCQYHMEGLESYFTENNVFFGKPKKHGFTFGIEFETDYASSYGRLEMLLESFLATSDSSINGPEFKSPIFYGTSAIKAFLPTIDELITMGDIGLNWEENGTHTHIGHVTLLNSLTMSYIRRFYHSLFIPLSDALKENPAKTKAIFGRNFVYYASPVNASSSAIDHCNFVNTQHNNTLEFRLCQYHNAEQYSTCLDFCRKVAEIVFNDFCNKILEDGLTEGQYLSSEKNEELKKLAQKTGKKLVKAWDKVEF